MKGYALEGISSVERARTELGRLLPEQGVTWLLKSSDGDAIAYFNVFSEEDHELAAEEDEASWRRPYISVDISGRHYNEDSSVISILRKLQSAIGGDIRNDDDELI